MKLLMSILAWAVIVVPSDAVAQTGVATLPDRAEKLVSSGQRSEALALYRQALELGLEPADDADVRGWIAELASP